MHQGQNAEDVPQTSCNTPGQNTEDVPGPETDDLCSTPYDSLWYPQKPCNMPAQKSKHIGRTNH
jgi:hypothetical protein